uniref:hypothetical protein n=1 Tax=Flavobacterium sp. TaxID=239 RepID=UPI00404B2C03
MKKISVFLSAMILFSLTMFSCSEDSKVESTPETTVSASLRVALNSMLGNYIPAAKMAIATEDDMEDDMPELCFDFVYPITLSYNTGTVVTVNSLDEIVGLLQTESSEAFINGIAFPFQIEYFAENLIITIENEQGFETLNLNCGDDYYDEGDFENGACYEFQFPISFVDAENQVFEVQDLNELYELFSNQTNVPIVDFVYPLSLLYNNEVVVIENLYQFVEIEDSCYELENPDDNCNCSDDLEPVCVEYEGVVYALPNACIAICEGFTESDFVACD